MQKYQGYARLNSTALPCPSATIDVFYAGTVVHASIFSDNLVPPTARANPFTADADGYFYFYAPDGRYDVQLSGGVALTGLITTPYTWGDNALLGGAVDADITATQNLLAAETTLYQTTLPANTITPNKKRVRITSRGTFAANANQKRLRMKYGSTTIYDSTLVVNGGNWEVIGEVTRTTPNAQVSFAKGLVESPVGRVTIPLGLQRTTPAEAATSAVTVQTTAQGVATADIVHDQSYTEEGN
jgi:hypothetical protein